MKTCPVCQRPYSDEEMIFCLADGTQLLAVNRNVDLDATWRFSPRIEPAPTQLAPTMPAPPDRWIAAAIDNSIPAGVSKSTGHSG